MHPRLFATLYKAIEDWSNKECESEEWESSSFWIPENMVLCMTNAANIIFDVVAETSHEKDENE